MTKMDGLKIEDTAEIDEEIEKANRLVEILREAKTLINSLSQGPRATRIELVITNVADRDSNNLVKEKNDFPNCQDIIRRCAQCSISEDKIAFIVF